MHGVDTLYSVFCLFNRTGEKWLRDFAHKMEPNLSPLSYRPQHKKTASAGPVRIPGLKRDAIYAVRLVNRDELPSAANFFSESPLLGDEAMHCHSATLKSAGLVSPNLCPVSMWILEGDIKK